MLKGIIKNNALILLVLLVILVKGIIFAMIIPLWQNHDEIEHFAYTQYLVEEKKIPVYQGTFKSHHDLTVSEEIAKADELLENSKISYGVFQRNQLIHQDFSNALTRDQMAIQLDNLDRQVNNQEYKNAAVIYSPLYYAIEAVPYLIFYDDDIITRSYAMRLFGIIFLLITVFFSYQLALLIIKNKYAAITVAILIGFLPRFSYTSAGINNDALLVSLSTILIYLLIKYLFQPLTFKKSICLGIIFGLGLLAKTQFIVFTPLLLGFFIYKFIKEGNRKTLIKSALVMLLFIIIISGWWFLFNYQNYHNILGAQNETINNKNSPQITFRTAAYYIILRYFYMFSSYFHISGCCHEILMAPIYQALFGISVGAGIFGFLLFLIQARKNKVKRNKLVPAITLVLFLIILEGFLLFIFLQGLFTRGAVSFPIDGRYLYPVIAALTVMFIIGLQKLIPKKIYGIIYLFLSLGIIIINTVNLIYYTIPRFYL